MMWFRRSGRSQYPICSPHARGYGFPSDFTLPAAQRLFPVQKDGREPQRFPPPDEWMAELSEVPLLYQPGEAWLYDTCSVLQGVLITRVSGQSLPEFLAERLFQPLRMVDTGFYVPADKLERLTSYYRAGPAGGLELADGPDGQWSTPPAFPLGNGGLVGTADDWLAFGRMLLAEGSTADGRQLLSADSVRLMISDHTTHAQRMIGELFLEGQGWGFGGSVDIATSNPWNVLGRYGWVAGLGPLATSRRRLGRSPSCSRRWERTARLPRVDAGLLAVCGRSLAISA